jgi:hypothetical protein
MNIYIEYIGTERHSSYMLTATFTEIISQEEHRVKECFLLRGGIIIPLYSDILR